MFEKIFSITAFIFFICLLGTAFTILALSNLEESRIRDTNHQVRKIVELTEKLEKFKKPADRPSDTIIVGKDSWDNNITLQFINDIAFVVISYGPDGIESADDIHRMGNIDDTSD